MKTDDLGWGSDLTPLAECVVQTKKCFFGVMSKTKVARNLILNFDPKKCVLG